jgi:hypothetical protein
MCAGAVAPCVCVMETGCHPAEGEPGVVQNHHAMLIMRWRCVCRAVLRRAGGQPPGCPMPHVRSAP